MSGPSSRHDTTSHDLQALSEAQLRQLYDKEEVDQFLSFFSAYVTEVRLSAGIASTDSMESHTLGMTTGRRPSNVSAPPSPHSLSEHIAYNYLLPYLPPGAGVVPAFTLKRLSLTAQRLYLALFPPYEAFISDMVQLALWKDHQRSLKHCIVFWFLWFYDLLLPALIFRVVFGLLRRHISSYPTLKELQERRQETAQALKFGEAIQQQLSVATLGPMEMWRLFRLYKSEGKNKRTETFDGSAPTSLYPAESDEEEHLKQNMLYALHELADLHERVKNIFTWRRPHVSRRYLLVLIVIGFGTFVLPAQYVAKLLYGFGGILFWHVTPVIAALPRADRTRASFLFRDAPTDGDYAMELIAKRIATGQDIGNASPSNQSRRTSDASTSTDNFLPNRPGTLREAQSSEDDGINWKKWGERVARGKAFLEEGRQFLSTRNSQNTISGETVAHRQGAGDTHSFLAQYASCPGLITLTPSTLFFTALTGVQARLVLPRDQLRGVRKSGLMKGISITWVPAEGLEEREEKFHWVGNRDELFARLVGSDGARWVRI